MNELTDEFSLPVFVIEISTTKILYCNRATEKLINIEGKNLYAKDISALSSILDRSINYLRLEELITDADWIRYIYDSSTPKFEVLNISRKEITYREQKAMMYVVSNASFALAPSSKAIAEAKNILNIISKSPSDPEIAIRNILKLFGEVFDADCIASFINEGPCKKYFHCNNQTNKAIALLRLTLKSNMEKIVSIYKNYSANKTYQFTRDNTNAIFDEFQKNNPEFCNKGLPKYFIPIKFPSSMHNNGMILIINARKKPTDDVFISALANMLSYFYYIISNLNQIEELSFYDNLTGFYNRNSFIKTKENLGGSSIKTLGVIFIDINGLKYTNDTYGHSFGDTVIISTSNAIKTIFNRNNVYRIGGDEFVIIITNINRTDFEERISKLENALIQDEYSSVSIGASFEQGNQISLNKMLEIADQRMYRQKKTFYELQKKQEGIGKIHLSHIKSQLEEAIANNQFSIFISPRFNLRENYVTGADSILHIDKPIFNITDSTQLISMLENADLMYPIDCYMIKLNCEFHHRLIQKNGKSVTTSINFSNRTFLHQGFKNYLLDMVNRYQVPYKYINIQIIYLEKQISPILISTVNQLNKMGFHTSINHFGVGESVFKPLQKLSLNSVKLDNSLTPALETNKGIITLKSILKMTNELRIDACLDAINTKKQVEKAISVGFTNGRGNYYSSSIPEKEFEELYVVPYLKKL